MRLARMQGQAGFGRTVAIKTLHPHVAKDAEFVAMLLDEARLASRVRHPNVVQVLDLVVTGTDVALVLDFVHGDSLARLWHSAQRCIPRAIALRVMVDVLRGLHAAHEATAEDGSPLGIVHRDVSPQNVLVGFDGTSRVLDFGIAKAAGRMQTTQDGKVKGKLAYMAPEQLLGGRVDRRTDVYAAGIIMWELLAGEQLYAGDPAEVFGKVAAAEVPPLGGDDACDGLRAIVARALSRAPDDRFATADEMANAIEREASASHNEVGRWAENASPNLATRLRRIQEIERAVVEPEEDLRDTEQTSATIEVPVAVPPSAPWRAALVVLATAIAGAALTMIGRDRTSSTNAAMTTGALSVTAAASASAPAASASPEVAAASTPTMTTSVVRSVSASPPAVKRPPPQPTRASAKSCDPPYTVDVEGNKQYMRECLRRP